MLNKKNRTADFKLYGWSISPYTAKVRAYLNYKGINYADIAPSALTLYRKIQPNVGKIIMPALETPEGEFLQDSTHIIAQLEQRFPNRGITPEGAKQQIVSMLIELFMDEWITTAALHYRWNYPENRPYLLKAMGKSAFPLALPLLSQQLVKPMANKIAGYVGFYGVTKANNVALEEATESLLGMLDQHFSEHAFVLGGTPSLADFGLYGQLYAVLDQDPYPQNLVRKYSALGAWLSSMSAEKIEAKGPNLDNDEIPETLTKIIKFMLVLQAPILADCVASVNGWGAGCVAGAKVPQKLGDTELVVGNTKATRANTSYPFWMLQRVIDVYNQFDQQEKTKIDPYFSEIGASELLNLSLEHRVKLDKARLVLSV